MKRYFMFPLLLLLAACGKAPADSETSSDAPMLVVQSYQQQLHSMMMKLQLGNEYKSLHGDSEHLAALSLVLLSTHNAAFSQCEGYLAPVISTAMQFSGMPSHEIKHKFLDEGMLPEFDDPLCYHIKELATHPSYIAALSVEPTTVNYAEIALQLRELQEHLLLLYPSLREK